MFTWLKKIFSKWWGKEKKLSLEDKIDLLSSGDIIKLKFKDPKSWGFKDQDQLSSRIDYTDLNTRTLTGHIMSVQDFHGICVVNLQVVKQNEHGTYNRSYVFLEDEIENIEYLSEKEELKEINDD